MEDSIKTQTIHIRWGGGGFIFNGRITVLFNNNLLGYGSGKNGFEFTVETNKKVNHLLLSYLKGIRQQSFIINLDDDSSTKNIELAYSRLWGNFKIRSLP